MPDDPARPWTLVDHGEALRPGQVRGLDVQGRAGVLWRGRSGELGVAEAWCPHLGAHLARGGWVDGDELVCRFHQWRFQSQGRCSALGYSADRIPSQANAQPWESREADGQIWVRPPVETSLSRRGVGQVPSAPGTFPKGWYKIAISAGVGPGEQHRVHYFGREITLSRPPNGALCAELGAAAGAPARPMPCQESGGLVLAWYGPADPDFPAPDFSRHEDPGCSRQTYDELVNSSLWDVAENPFDVAHLRSVHHLVLDAPPEIRAEGTSLHLDFRARFSPPIGALSPLAGLITMHTHVEGFGLGLTETLVNTRMIEPTWMIGCNTPVDDKRTEYTLIFISAPHPAWKQHIRVMHAITAALIWKVTEVERMVWGEKQYLMNPCLTPSERGIGRFRRWARQFECA